MIVCLGSFLVVVPSLMTAVSAQGKSIEVTYTFDLSDTGAEPGDIISYLPGIGLKRADETSASQIFGVLQTEDSPLLVYKRVDNSGKPIVRNGISEVNVTTLNGEIKPGDQITSSEVAGKGQKGTSSGYVLGIALEGFKDTPDAPKLKFTQDKTKEQKTVSVGKIPVSVKIEYAEISGARSSLRLLGYINAALFRSVKDPEKFILIIRYVIAGLVLIGSLAFAFLNFAKSLPKSIEAIGRNPLSEKAIRTAMAMNIGLTIGIAVVAVAGAVLIIVI